MTKNPARRLGCTGNENQIRSHAFFKDLDWEALEQRKVRPPFKPKIVSVTSHCKCFEAVFNDLNLVLQRSPKDALNFDAEFTKEEPVLTPVPNDVMRCINQEEFAGFSFVNPNFGPERRVC